MWRGIFVQLPVRSSYLRKMSTEGQIAGLYHRARKTVRNLWCAGCNIRKRILLFMLFWLWKETENECMSSEEVEFSLYQNLLRSIENNSMAFMITLQKVDV